MVMATNPTPAATQPASAPSVNTAQPANQLQGQQQSSDSTGAVTVSPESVGRLFVQQYYTVLNKAPNLLHRFYTHNSSFVHGKVYRDGNSEEPVYGPDIYYKILTLEFRDCFAKIRQVDSYATLGDGVVVQVTGELSTHGKPMRRFTQTFVLAPHSAKNYYVRNDIFRYHDEVFQEADEEEEDNEVSAEEEAEETRSEPSEPAVSQDAQNISRVTPVKDTNIPPYCESPQPSVSSNGTAHLDSPTATPPKPPSLPPQQDDQEEPEEEPQELIPPQPQLTEEQHPSPVITPPPPVEPVVENHEREISEEDKEEAKEPVNPGLKSWADRARQGTAVPTSAPAPAVVATKPPSQPPVAGPPVPKATEGFGSNAPRAAANEGLPQREPRRERREGQRWTRSRPAEMGAEGERTRRGGENSGGRNYPDNQQLFVGNLPQNIKDDELMEYFSQYGKVVEMRINRNANPKLPYFGFIVFDEPGPVKNILELKKNQAILFRDGYRLNVEEKKAKGTDARPRGRDNRPGSGGGPPPRGGPPGQRGPRGGGTGAVPNRGGGGGRMYNPQR